MFSHHVYKITLCFAYILNMVASLSNKTGLKDWKLYFVTKN